MVRLEVDWRTKVEVTLCLYKTCDTNLGCMFIRNLKDFGILASRTLSPQRSHPALPEHQGDERRCAEP